MIAESWHARTMESAFDVCIIGAGAAGIIVARELSAAGFRVALLESGLNGPSQPHHNLFRGQTEGLVHKGFLDGRFRGLGGSTREWGGQFLELDDADFEKREWIPGSGWPIPKTALYPFYNQVLDLVSLGTTNQDKALSKEISKLPLASKFDLRISKFAVEPRFSALFGSELSSRKNLVLLLDATVTNLRVNPLGQFVEAAEFTSLNKRRGEVSAKYFILCAGAIETIRLLMQPRPGAQIWQHSPMLGRHFMDHIVTSAATFSDFGLDPRLTGYFLEQGIRRHCKFRLPAAAQREQNTLNVAGTLQREGRLDRYIESNWRPVRLIKQGRWREIPLRSMLPASFAVSLKAVRRAVEKARPLPPPELVLRVHSEQAPLSSSHISLSPNIDECGNHKVRLTWHSNQLEQHTIHTYTEAFKRAVASLSGIKPAVTSINQEFEDNFHHLGGCRMGTHAQSGVVDENLRVFGAKNVYLCSGAVFPTGGFSNPTHTLLALGLRLSHHLIGQMRTQ